MEITPDAIEKSIRDTIAQFKLQNLNTKTLELKLAEHLVKHKPKYSPHADKVLATYLTSDDYSIQLKADILKMASEEDAVLIIGESGTGKEILAQSLHGERKGIFVSINCAGMPKDLIESELFGHKRGAFSGADMENIGLFKQADGGTLFLDEVGDLHPSLQAKFLRAIQSRRYRPVGATMEQAVNCRIIAATHHNIPDLVDKGLFRLDLYARLSTIEFITKPLRDRRDDIELLCNSIDKTGKTFIALNSLVRGDSKEHFLSTHPFPLNVRDVQRLVRRYQLFGIERIM